jgi:hypothetical protein
MVQCFGMQFLLQALKLDPLRICSKPEKVAQLTFQLMKLLQSQLLSQRKSFLLSLLCPTSAGCKVGRFVFGKNRKIQFLKCLSGSWLLRSSHVILRLNQDF